MTCSRTNFPFNFSSLQNVELTPQYVRLSDNSFGDDLKSNSPTSDDLGSLFFKNLSVHFLNICFLVKNCNYLSMPNLFWDIVSYYTIANTQHCVILLKLTNKM